MTQPDGSVSSVEMPSAPLADAPASRRREKLAIKDGGLSGLVWRGLLLKIITLGIYRFWYKTNLRRWYWSRTRISGDALEYTGTGRELIVGFLFALAIMVPLYLLAAAASLLAGEQLGSIISAIVAVIFAVLIQYGVYRSRRYRLTRTRWRGLQFDQSGSAWTYALKSIGWAIASFLTLFLAAPWARVALERYKIENTSFGTAKGSFDVKGGQLFPYWLVLWITIIFAMACLLAGPFVVAGGWSELESVFQDAAEGEAVQKFFFMVIGAVVIGALAIFLAWPYYRAAEFRLFTSNTKIGGVSFEATLGAGQLYRIYLTFAGCLAAYAAAASLLGYLVLRGARFDAMLEQDAPAHLIVLLAIPVYLGFFLFAGWAREVVLSRGIWLRSAESMSVENLDSVNSIVAQARSGERATGEGFADAIDFGGV